MLWVRKFVLFGLCASLGACTTKKTEEKMTIDPKLIVGSAKSPQEAAERLALAGEQLFSPVSFMYADEIFDLVLKVDPNNERAQFYKAFLAPWMALKGSVNRVKPLVDRSDEKTKKEYQDFIDKAPESALKTFLMAGPQDLKTEEDVLKFVDEYNASWDKFRSYVKSSKNKTFEINIMTLVGVAGALDSATRECHAERMMNGTYQMDARCNYLKALKVKLSRADFEALQHVTAGFLIYSNLLSAYRVDGLADFYKPYADKDQSPTEQEFYEHFRKVAEFGKLRTEKKLSSIIGFGTDAIAGVRWAMSIQSELCPSRDASNIKNRQGYLFRQGFCIDKNEVNEDGENVDQVLARVEAVLGGGTSRIFGRDNYGREVSTEIKPAAPLRNPVKDLKPMFPISYNNCGRVVAFADPTLGGVFFKGDANTYLKKTGSLDQCDEWQNHPSVLMIPSSEESN